MGGVYGQICCLPPKISAKVDSINLISLFYSDHRKEFGNHIIFEKIIDDINYLQKHGFNVVVNKVSYKVYIKCILIIGDNMGINSILGFAESFTANFFCKICRVSNESSKKMCLEDKTLLRNEKNYLSDVSENNVSITGVKQLCTFHRINGYHVTNNYNSDIMHDILEGVGSYDLRNLICTFIELNFFSIETLNFRISNFNYNENDKSNRPPFLKE